MTVPNDNKLRREDFMGIAHTVEHDFRRLVDTLERALNVAPDDDQELVERLLRTRDVAERGLRLSKLISGLIRKDRAYSARLER